MKADEMIDFVLGQVDGADRDRLEQSLRGGGESVVRIERLRRQSTGCSMTGPLSNTRQTWPNGQ